MRIGLNLRTLVPGQIGGMETYVRELVRRLPTLDDGVALVLLCSGDNHATFESTPGVERRHLGQAAFDRLTFRDLAHLGLDLWFCPLFDLEPFQPGIPSVITIPDVQHLRHPEFFDEEVLAWRQRRLPESARLADRVLTLSEFSREEIALGLEIDPAKIHAIHLDASVATGSPATEEPSRIRRRRGLPARFLYYPANGWPHKNHARLFEALARIRQRRGDCPALALSGVELTPGRWEQAIRRHGLDDRVRILGHLPAEELPSIYASARAMVFPSLYEGFGLPLVEAMRSGCPVICSSAASLPEVAGGAASFFDPESTEDLIRAIEEIWEDGGLRSELRRKGTRRARDFSWDSTARQTLRVLRDLRARQSAEVPNVAVSEPPLISVVTPSFQQGRFIERTLRSVLEQDYPRVEYLVIDGGSRDETLRILDRYAERYPGILRYVSEPDHGQADAVNKGIERSTGEIVGWLNSDDTLAPGCLASVARAFGRDSREWLYGRANYIDEQDRPLHPYPTYGTFDWHELARECFLCQPAVFLRRSLLDRGYRLDADLQLCMDYDLWIRIGREHEPMFLDRYLVNSRLHGDAKTTARRAECYAEIFRTVKKHYGYLPQEWAMGRAHTLVGGDTLRGRDPLSWKGYALMGAFLLRYNWSNPRYLKHVGARAGRHAARKLRRTLSPRAGHG